VRGRPSSGDDPNAEYRHGGKQNQERPEAGWHRYSLPDRAVSREPVAHERKAEITSVPMSSMVCITDSCDTL